MRHVKIHIKSQQYEVNGYVNSMRPGGAYVVTAAEGKKLEDAGIALIVEDPCHEELTFPEIVKPDAIVEGEELAPKLPSKEEVAHTENVGVDIREEAQEVARPAKSKGKGK